MKPRIAYLGLGNMGIAMAKRFLAAGYPLSVWNRNPEKACELVALGAQLATTPAESVKDADFVFTMVADDRALQEIALGQAGFLAQMKPGSLHVSMSTILPKTAQGLAQQHAAGGTGYVAAPVFGRPSAAAEGMLWICLSGAAEAKTRVMPLLETLSQKRVDFGLDPGGANIVKLSGNFLIASAIESMSEAFAFAEKNGIDPAQLNEFFGTSIFACPIYKNYGGIITRKEYSPAGFRLTLGRKDVELVAETARSSAVPMPVLSTLVNRFAARVAKGGGDLDWTSIAIDVAADAGLPPHH